jgi:chaperonin GroEL
VAVIRVGAATETEMKEKKARSRTRCTRPRPRSRRASCPAAVSRCSGRSPALEKLLADPKLSADTRSGIKIVRRAIEEPARWIATNAGQEATSWSASCGR